MHQTAILYFATLVLMVRGESNVEIPVNHQSSLKIDCSPRNIDLKNCPSDAECSKLGPECLSCMCPSDCQYGQTNIVICRPHQGLTCSGEQDVALRFNCRYCYQTNIDQHLCRDNFECQSTGDPNKLYFRANCTVHDDVICLGRRNFMKQKQCNWTGGYKWTTALALSITLGGFGADRFYLGHWQEGIGKLFSFGGLGVWTLVDVILIGIRYVGPADGSLYI